MFVVDFAVSLCLDGDCSETFPLLKQSRIPQLGCNTNFTLPGGSIHGFMKYLLNDTIENVGQELSEAGINAVLKHLGLDDVLSVKDGQFRAPDDIETVSGWSVPELNQSTSMPSLPDGWVCVVNDNLLGTKCYFSVDLIAVTLRTTLWMDLDMCTYTFSAGIGLKTFSFRLFDYNYGEERTLIAGSVFSLRYTIGLDEETDSFVLDLGVTLCVDSICTDITLWSGFRAPRPGCGENVILGDYTLDEFLAMVADASLGSATRTATEAALEALGLHKVLSIGESCDMPEGLENGWKGAQRKEETLEVGEMLTFTFIIDNIQTEDVFQLDFAFRLCFNEEMTDCTEVTLLQGSKVPKTGCATAPDIPGEESTLDVGDALHIRYTIGKDPVEKVFVVDFSVQVCIDSDCTEPVPLLNQAGLPQPLCQRNASYQAKWPGGGSFSEFVTTYGNELGTAVADLAFEKWGVSDLLLDSACTLVGQNSANRCELNIAELGLSDDFQFAIRDFCFGIETCVEMDLVVLRKTLKAEVRFDPCNYTLSISLGSRRRVLTLLDVEWGVEQTWQIGTLFQIRHTIWNMAEHQNYRISLDIDICLDEGACSLTHQVLQDLVFPKPFCNFNGTLQFLNGMSTTAFLNSLDPASLAADALESQLIQVFEALEIADLYSTATCTAAVPDEAPSCSWTPDIPDVDIINCRMTESCTGIMCCVDFDFLAVIRSFKVYFDIDFCMYKLVFGIGSRQYEYQLFTLPLAEEQTITIGQAFYIRFIIYQQEMDFRVHFAVSLCIDGRCVTSVDLLSGATINKPLCNMTSIGSYQLPGDDTIDTFAALSKDFGEEGLRIGIEAVFRKLGIADMLSEGRCVDPAPVPITRDCSDNPLPELPGVSCVHSQYCLGITCCVEIDLKITAYSFRTWLTLDPEAFRLSAGIGTREFEYSMFTFPWGVDQEIIIGTVFKLLYNTDDLTAEKAFSLSLSLDVSVGSPVTSLPGLFVRRSAENRVHFPLLVRSVVPKRVLSTDFTLPGNGTIAGFREFLGGLGVDPMDVSAEALFRSLGISELFVSEPCTEVVNTNVPETCSNPNATLPNTHGLLTCGYSEDCSGIECCIILDFKIFTRNFKLWFKVDTNVYSMSLGFGNVTWTPSIFTFPWGLQQSQTIGDVLEIRYAVEKIGYQYKTYLEINLNVEGDYLNIPILNGHMFQEPQLDLSEPVSLPDSSVSFFLSEVGYSAETPMANIIQQAVFRHYDIFDFVDVTCDSAAIKSTVSCPNIPLPESDDAHCAVNEDCSGIHCCVTVDLVVVERSFLVTFKVNPDDFELRFSFANKSFGVNLFGVPWGLQQDISVGNIFELVYKVDSFDFGKQFQVDFSLSSSIDNVRQEVQLLEGVHLTSPTESSVGVGNAELLSIGDILAAIKELPMTLQKEEILPFVASEIGMEVDDLRSPDEWREKLDAASVPDCPLADVSRNTSALTNGMVECIPLSYCQGIKCHVIFDLKVVQPKIQLSFELMPCFPGFGLRLRLENVEKNIMFGSKYDVREGPTEYESFGEVLKLRYRVLLTDDQQFRSTFSLLVCVNRICFVNVDLVTDIVIPRPSSCGRRRRGVKVTGAGLSFLQDNNFEQRQVGAIFHGDVQFCQEKLRSHHTGQVSLKKEQVSDSVNILYSVVNPDDHRVVISLTLKVCDGETTNETCKNIKVLKEVVVPLFGCRLDKTEAVSATASYHRYKRSVPISSVGQTQINLHRERYTSQATYNRQKQLIKERLDRRNAVIKVVKREPSTCAANEFWDNTIGEVRDMLDLHAVDPVIAFQLIKDLQELYAQLVEEAIDLLLSKSEEDIFSSFDIKLRGTFSFPRRTVNFFSYETFFLIGGMVPATFGFGANGYYGADLSVVASLMNMNVQGGITPYLGVQVYGELGVGALLYAKLRLEGDIMETRFPITAEIRFSKFPMDVGMTLDIELIPLQLKLKALVTLEIKIPFIGTIKKTLFKKTLWKYTTSSIKSRILDLHTWEPDNSAPELETVGGGGSEGQVSNGSCLQLADESSARRAGVKRRTSRRKSHPAARCKHPNQNQHVSLELAAGRKRRDNDYLPHQTRECMVKQLKGLDYTEPAIQIEITANDDRSKVPLTYSVGTVPNSDDVVSKEELGGPTTVLKRDLTFGVPLYFTAEACNNAGLCSQATCSMSTYDNTLPGGRIDAAFLSSSNQYKLSAVAKLFDDSDISQMRESVGFGKGTWSDQIHPWSEFQLTKNSATSGGDPLSSFTPEVLGRLTAESFEEIKGATVDGPNPGKCALQCLRYPGTKCMSFNFDFESKDCQLLSAIEAVGQKQGSRRERSGFYHYYERLGVGHTAKFEHAGLSLQHNHLYFFNVEVVNTLGYTGTLASEGVVADFTPPEPGYVGTGKSDYVTLDSCQNMLIDNWDRRCVDHTDIPNHRIIHDGPESETVFNGIEPNIGVYHTRANTYIAANWKGIRDDETGIYGYSWSVGESPGKDLIHPHIDPHAHLYNETEWTHSGNIHPIPADKFPNSILPDGKYYITVRGVNKVEYGGPMVLSVSHTSPYIIDNTPPDVHAITSVKYNEETSQIFVAYNMSDVESDIREADLGFGKTKYDVLLKSWVRHLYTGNETHVGNFTMEVALEDGVPAWAKIRGINKVNLRAVGVADSPIVVDRTGPIAGEVYDGDQVGEDLQFINKAEEVCANWKDFYDEDSGIKDFMWGVGSTPGELDILEYVKVSSSEHVWCSNIDTELQHNLTYYSTIVATHNGHRGLNVSGISNGVLIDLTPPEAGWVVDGNYMDMDPSTGLPMDEVFTSEPAMVSAQWGEFVDPESDIDSYSVSVWRSALISDGAWGAAEEIHEPDKLDKEKTQVEYFHFQLSHGDRIYTAITARNGATDTTEGRSNGVIVDLTAPDLQYLVDTQANENNTIEDSDYQTNENSISSSWEFEDQESGIDHYKIAIIETMHGTKQQIYPGKCRVR
ncbi:Hypp6488 [Branchiostoma lanceolatum]|uniref:Hypp6488 protein n=1 Tax=Branchiostoma lanceolatum TaxID=7740 RepID=A0A8J9YUU9_BRALA|nr:Hypp6488 [Branchiostoma lanceolatum]